MKNKILKVTAVPALAMLFVFAPATQTLACHGYGHGYYGHYGYYGYSYYPSATQQNYTPVPQSYTSQANTNDFDPTVYEIQVVLFDKGYYEGELDGLYGSVTKAALLSFQSDNDIPETEDADIVALKADEITLEALGL